jgi:hypothetical protein
MFRSYRIVQLNLLRDGNLVIKGLGIIGFRFCVGGFKGFSGLVLGLFLGYVG